MSESAAVELAHWQARCDEMQVALETIREERDNLRMSDNALREDYAVMEHLYTECHKEVKLLRSVVSRIQVAMSQGQEL